MSRPRRTSGPSGACGAAPVTEAQAERAVVELFELYGWEVRRIREDFHNRDGYGLPDLLCTAPVGHQLWIEMKRPPSSRNPRGRVRKAQKKTLIEWRRRGVLCCVADGASETLHDIAKLAAHDLLPGFALLSCDVLMAAYDWWPAQAPVR